MESSSGGRRPIPPADGDVHRELTPYPGAGTCRAARPGCRRGRSLACKSGVGAGKRSQARPGPWTSSIFEPAGDDNAPRVTGDTRASEVGTVVPAPKRDERLGCRASRASSSSSWLVVHHVAQEVRRKREHLAPNNLGSEDVVQRRTTRRRPAAGRCSIPGEKIRERHRAHQSLKAPACDDTKCTLPFSLSSLSLSRVASRRAHLGVSCRSLSTTRSNPPSSRAPPPRRWRNP